MTTQLSSLEAHPATTGFPARTQQPFVMRMIAVSVLFYSVGGKNFAKKRTVKWSQTL